MAKTPSKPTQKTLSAAQDRDGDSVQLPTIQEEIDRQIGDLVPQGSRSEVVARITTMLVSEFFSGPIAHPRHLREYEEICPGSANRIIAMAEDRNNHIMTMDRATLGENAKDQKLGMLLGGGLFAFLVLAALIAAVWTQSAVMAGVFLAPAAVGVIGLFIKGRNGKS